MINSVMIEFEFMRHALLAVLALSVLLPPLGLFMMARRMSLMGDAVSHALLPGIVLAVLFFGTSLLAMTVGALLAGVMIAALTFFLTKFGVREDAGFAAITVLSLSLGVALLPLTGGALDLTHLLFGSILTLNNDNLRLLFGATLIVSIVFIAIYRFLVIDTVDPSFQSRSWVGLMFLGLTIIALVASFQAIGTLLAVGLMLIPGLIAKLWVKFLKMQIVLSIFVALVSGFIGLTLSFYVNLTPGPAILLAAGLLYLLSLLLKTLLGLLPVAHLKG